MQLLGLGKQFCELRLIELAMLGVTNNLLLLLPMTGKCQCSDGDARLIQQETDYLCGRLEVCHSGVWGTVCDNGIDTNAAQAACQQLSAGNGTFNRSCLING